MRTSELTALGVSLGAQSLQPLKRKRYRFLAATLIVYGSTGLALADGRSPALVETPAEAPAPPMAPSASLVPAGTTDKASALKTPRPTEWASGRGRQCPRVGPPNGRYRAYCDGPRRVPQPSGKASEFAERLGLGTRQAAVHLMTRAPTEAWMSAARGEIAADLYFPIEGGHLGRGLGYVRRERREIPHLGVDILAPQGTPIHAINDGVVVYSDNGVRGYGNMLLVLHPDGTVSLYAHCRANYVFAGQRVLRGQILGEVGQTGIARGAHLHFEWRRNGRPLDPSRRFSRELEAEILPAAPGTATAAATTTSSTVLASAR